MSATDHFLGTHVGRQRFVEREDGHFRRDMAKLFIDFFKCCRASAQIDDELLRGLKRDEQHPIEQLR